MAEKRTPQKSATSTKGAKSTKKQSSILKPPTEKERAKWRKNADAEMKKHGFKTVDELIEYYDSKRGY